MKGRWGLRLCWNLFCLLLFVSYTSKAIIVLPKLRSKRPIITDVPSDVPTHDEYSLVRDTDTASLIRIRRVVDNSNNQYNISKTTVIDLAHSFELSRNSTVRSSVRWIGSPPYQVSAPPRHCIRFNIS